MSIPFHKTPAFKKLNEKWKKKLEKSGFDDIEQDEEHLKLLHSTQFYRARANEQAGGIQAKMDYYHLTTQFLNEYSFETAQDKRIWEEHDKGLKVPEIVKELKIKTSTVKATVTKLKKSMSVMYLGKSKEEHE